MAILEDYVSLKQAAEISGYHADYIGMLIRSGQVKGTKIGNRWFVNIEEVKVHFSTKHYAPASRVFLSKKTVVISGAIVVGIACVAFVSAYFIERGDMLKSATSTPAAVIPTLDETGAAATSSSVNSVNAGNSENKANGIIIQQP